MESSKLNQEEIIDLIFYGIKKNGMEAKSIDALEIRKIFNRYNDLYIVLKNNYINGELDTFKNASCLLVAINRSRLFSDKRLVANIAVAAAYKMCEKPYWNVGENNDIPSKMEEVDFDNFKLDSSYGYETATNMMIDSLVYENGEPINYYLNLELFYQTALNVKHKTKKLICMR